MINNRLTELFKNKTSKILNVYFTAGHPKIEDFETILQSLDESGVDIVEIGMPYSDPLADGLVIQRSSKIALDNGMNLDILFEKLYTIRPKLNMAVVLMGYYNQMLQYGVEKFIETSVACGVDGLIIPDLIFDEYKNVVQKKMINKNLSICFLITPNTSDARIKIADQLTTGFIYAVSQNSITGGALSQDQQQSEYFSRISSLNLNNPVLIGFGIKTKEHFANACKYSSGAIIGSEFIRTIEECNDNLKDCIRRFVEKIKGQ